MSARIVKGKEIADKVREKLRARLRPEAFVRPVAVQLVNLQVGEDTSSGVYAKAQRAICEDLGIRYVQRMLPSGASEQDLIAHIRGCNEDPAVHGVLLHMPLPEGLNKGRIIGALAANKDVEGVHLENLGRVLVGDCALSPCTPCAIMTIIEDLRLDLYGRETVIIGHSTIVGKPLALMLLNRYATVTVCHIATSERGDLGAHTRRADLLVVAAGKKHLVSADMVKPGAVVIDAGINACGTSVVGDVDFEKVKQRAGIITPVPGGVGPVTVVMLIRNLVTCLEEQGVLRKGQR